MTLEEHCAKSEPSQAASRAGISDLSLFEGRQEGDTRVRELKGLAAPSILIIPITIAFAAPLLAAEGFSGQIFFRSGESVSYRHLGNLVGVREYVLTGNLGAQRVRYALSDFSELVVDNKEDRAVVVVSRGGDRFTITNARLLTQDRRGDMSSTSTLLYVYQDPITRKLERSSVSWQELSHVTIGEATGDIKVNPATGEYFPAMYVFDPFTGEELEWSSRDAPR